MKKDNLDKPVTKGQFDLAMKEANARMDGLVTKEEFTFAMKKVDSRMDTFATKDDLRNAMTNMKNYVDNRFDELKEIMYTKADHQVFMIWMDEAMKELRDTREGRVLTEGQMLRMDDKIANHESRICVLEKKF